MAKRLLISIILLIFTQISLADEHLEPETKWSFLGKPSSRTVLLGMWTTHLWTNQFDPIQANNLIGFVDHGLFIGSFTNSFAHRSYAAGINRYWSTKHLTKEAELQLGYRLGLVYGYRKDEVLLTDTIPVIPFIQLVADLSWKKVGIELSTTGQVVSGSFFFRF